eukprot:2900575-Amphidinium_carterae.1
MQIATPHTRDGRPHKHDQGKKPKQGTETAPCTHELVFYNFHEHASSCGKSPSYPTAPRGILERIGSNAFRDKST